MAAKKKRKPRQPQAAETIQAPAAEPSVPKFEIGVKGDEFDLKYTRAASASKTKADSLLRSLSKETRVAGYNLISLCVLTILLVLMALSFAFLSRGAEAPKMSLASLADGSYTAELKEYYKNTLPFGRAFKSAWAFLGFGQAPEDLPNADEEEEPDDWNVPDDDTPEHNETVPAVTTAPVTDETPTSAPITEPTQATVPDTVTMYTKDTASIRLLPESDAMVMGYFEINEEVQVIELRSDGWAAIYYNGVEAYISSDYLVEQTVATTKKRVTTVTTTEEVTEEITTVPEETEAPTETETAEVTTVPEEITEEATTTQSKVLDPEMSKYIERQSILESKRQATATTEPQPDPEDPTEATEPTEAPVSEE